MKEKTAVQELPAEKTREETLKQIGRMALCALIGLLSAHTQVYGGIAPFGVAAAAAASGGGAVIVYLASSVGYLLSGDTLSALRYIAAVAAVGGIRFALGGIGRVTAHRLFAPVAAFAATLLTGVALGFGGSLSLSFLLILLGESLLAGGFAYFFGAAIDTLLCPKEERSTTVEQQVSLILVAAVLLMSVSDLELGGISPGRILTVLLILFCARAGREAGGAIAGVVLGAAVAFTAGGTLQTALGFAFGGLLGGLFSRFSKWAAALAFLCGNILLSLTADLSVDTLIAVYETAAAGVLFLAVPRTLDRRLYALLCGEKESSAVADLRRSVAGRLEVASAAMAEVAGTVDIVSQKLAGVSAPDLGSIYFGVSDTVCRRCGMRLLCWERELNETMDAFNHLTVPLRDCGRVERKDVSGRLERSCPRLSEVLSEVNRGYAEHRLRESAWRRLAEIRAVVSDQFSGMAELLSGFSEDIARDERIDAEAALRVRRVCEQYGIEVERAVCTVCRDNRMQVTILASDSAAKLRRKEWLHELGAACGREFAAPQTERVGDGVRIRLTEKTRYVLRLGSAQLSCGQERLCGYAFEYFEDGEGHAVTVLSDGMGSGGRAAVDGAMAAGLTARLLRAGFGGDSVLRMVKSALMVKSNDESLATLDVLKDDLFNGRIESLKAGAAASLLCSKGRVSRLERSSLPIGILRDVTFEKQTDTLVEGDLLLL